MPTGIEISGVTATGFAALFRLLVSAHFARHCVFLAATFAFRGGGFRRTSLSEQQSV